MGPNKRQLGARAAADAESRSTRRSGLLHFGQGKWYPGRAAAALVARLLLAQGRRADLERPGAVRRRGRGLRRDRGAGGAVPAHARSAARPRSRSTCSRPTRTPATTCGASAGCRRTSIPSMRASTTRWSARACARSSTRVWTRSRLRACRRAKTRTSWRWQTGSLVPARRALLPDPRRFADGLAPAARFAAVGRRRRPAAALHAPDPFQNTAASCRAARSRIAASSEQRRRRGALRPRAARRSNPPPGSRAPRSAPSRANGVLYVFMPPRASARGLPRAGRRGRSHRGRAAASPVILEGYEPPRDPRLEALRVTPDPGVIEVNIHPATSWDELVDHTTVLYEAARETRLTTEKFMLDGRHTGTGGGNHIVLGGADAGGLAVPAPARPARSLVAYWHNHPSLSLPVLGHVRRPDQPGAARRRGAQRLGLRARDRLQRAATQTPGSATARRGSSTACSATC